MEDNNNYIVFLENSHDKLVDKNRELKLEINYLQDLILKQYMIMHNIKNEI